MKRRLQLAKLLAANGGAAQVARESGTPKSHFSAMVAGRRGLGDELAGKLERLYGKPSGWFDLPQDGESTVSTVTEFAERRAAYLPVTVDAAIQAIADHLADFHDKAKAISLLTTLVHSPHLAGVVAAELKDLHQEAREGPAKQIAPEKKASNAGTR